ncbi:UNVERIFIED_CONTAM: hypothetical protein FKN15_034214 [Acipenser sinensis]
MDSKTFRTQILLRFLARVDGKPQVSLRQKSDYWVSRKRVRGPCATAASEKTRVGAAACKTRNQLKNKVPENQKIFQEDNGLPVHIKGGTVDVLLYRFTMAITLGGGCMLF